MALIIYDLAEEQFSINPDHQAFIIIQIHEVKELNIKDTIVEDVVSSI